MSLSTYQQALDTIRLLSQINVKAEVKIWTIIHKVSILIYIKRYSLIITIASQSSTLFLISMTIKSYLKEIETQSKKPISEQLNDLKIAGAKLLQALDNYIEETNNERT